MVKNLPSNARDKDFFFGGGQGFDSWLGELSSYILWGN